MLLLHSWMRWLVLLLLSGAVLRAIHGQKTGRAFTPVDDLWRRAAVIVAWAQLTIGIGLYSTSPLVRAFWPDYFTTVKVRELRFFSMEHSLMMIVAVIVLTLGALKTRRQVTDADKFRIMVKWYGWALFLIFTSVPWPFLPISPHRPLFRW